jgi:hypothetical protein
VPRVPLHCHPATGSGAVEAIEADVARDRDGALALEWTLCGDTSHVCIPAPATPGRREELWRHTCFELFVRGAGGRYCEWNFSPSGEWAAYAFAAYRDGMTMLELREAPQIESRVTPSRLELSARVRLPEAFAVSASARLALSAVVEDGAGALSYWALAHAGARPDFHAPEGFVLPLPAAANDR